MDGEQAPTFPRTDIEPPITDRFERLAVIHRDRVAVQDASKP